MKILIILIALNVHVFSQSANPFAEKTEELDRRPQRLAPSRANLKKFGEPSLKGSAPANTSDMRFIWVPTFNKPISIRVTKTMDKVILRAVRMSGKGGYDWEKIELEKTLALTE